MYLVADSGTVVCVESNAKDCEGIETGYKGSLRLIGKGSYLTHYGFGICKDVNKMLLNC